MTNILTCNSLELGSRAGESSARSTTAGAPLVIAGHISALDGLRAFAILAVMFHHYGEYYLLRIHPNSLLLRAIVENLGMGVDLFFVLSGFLITGILLDGLGKPYFFKRFYWRRGLRIWPLYYFFLAGVLLVHGQMFSRIGLAPFALYYRNFLGPDHASDIYIGQFWSLCVEEQFYLVWPVVLFLLAKRWRLPLIILLIAAAFCFRMYFSSIGMNPYIIYRLPICHMDVLLAGASLAVLTRMGIADRTFRKLCWIAFFGGISGLLVLETSLVPQLNFILSALSITSSALMFGGLVGICLRAKGTGPRAFLGSDFLGAISKRSYAMYVFHLLPLYASFVLLDRARSLPNKSVAALVLMVLVGLVTYGMALVSWKFLEEPVLRLKKWEWFAR
ncbi:MAG: acyltransferase [Acidobacteriota bacterium]